MVAVVVVVTESFISRGQFRGPVVVADIAIVRYYDIGGVPYGQSICK